MNAPMEKIRFASLADLLTAACMNHGGDVQGAAEMVANVLHDDEALYKACHDQIVEAGIRTLVRDKSSTLRADMLRCDAPVIRVAARAPVVETNAQAAPAEFANPIAAWAEQKQLTALHYMMNRCKKQLGDATLTDLAVEMNMHKEMANGNAAKARMYEGIIAYMKRKGATEKTRVRDALDHTDIRGIAMKAGVKDAF